jgi:hypothetical protein
MIARHPSLARWPHPCSYPAMCNLYYADLWIMPTISSERALAAAIAALESA